MALLLLKTDARLPFDASQRLGGNILFRMGHRRPTRLRRVFELHVGAPLPYPIPAIHLQATDNLPAILCQNLPKIQNNPLPWSGFASTRPSGTIALRFSPYLLPQVLPNDRSPRRIP